MSNVDEQGAIWIPSPNKWSGRFGLKPKWLIIHGTAGGVSAEAVAHNVFGQTKYQASAHYIIGRDGHVVQCVREGDSAWSNGAITGTPGKSGDGIHHDVWWGNVNPNLLTISIEHVKDVTTNIENLTPAQQAASFKLVKNICERNGIPLRAADSNGGITGHFSMDPINRSHCPGNYPWQELWNYLKPAAAKPEPVRTSTPPTQTVQIEELTKQIADLNTLLGHDKSLIGSLQNQLATGTDALTALKKSADQEIAALKNELAALQQSSEKQISELNSENSALHQQMLDLSAKLLQANQDTQAAQKELAEYQKYAPFLQALQALVTIPVVAPQQPATPISAQQTAPQAAVSSFDGN